MRKLITFSGQDYDATTKRIVDSAPWSGADETYVYDPAQHDPDVSARVKAAYGAITDWDLDLDWHVTVGDGDEAPASATGAGR